MVLWEFLLLSYLTIHSIKYTLVCFLFCYNDLVHPIVQSKWDKNIFNICISIGQKLPGNAVNHTISVLVLWEFLLSSIVLFDYLLHTIHHYWPSFYSVILISYVQLCNKNETSIKLIIPHHVFAANYSQQPSNPIFINKKFRNLQIVFSYLRKYQNHIFVSPLGV